MVSVGGEIIKRLRQAHYYYISGWVNSVRTLLAETMTRLNVLVASFLLLALLVVHGQCTMLDDLYPFGMGEGDSVLEAPVTDFNESLSVASASIQNISIPFPLYGNNYSSGEIFVSCALYNVPNQCKMVIIIGELLKSLSERES